MKRALLRMAGLFLVGSVLGTSAAAPRPSLTARPATQPAAAPTPAVAAEEAPALPTIRPRRLLTNRSDVRALAASGSHLWVATGGGLERYDLAKATEAPRVFGTLDGLDTIDVRAVQGEGPRLIAETATARCVLDEGDRFACSPHPPRPPALLSKDAFAGHAVSARLELPIGEIVGTRGGGAFLLPKDGAPSRRLGSADEAPASFAHKAARFGDALFLATFRDGLVRLRLGADGTPRAGAKGALATEPVPAPFAMVNDVAVVGDVLYVAANEGFFSSSDGRKFELVPAIGARSITGVAPGPNGSLWVTSTGALYAVPAGGRGRVLAAHLAPAGSRSVQGVASDGASGAWLATEDRGAVHFDGRVFTAWDRLAGLPSSWVVGVTADGAGGVYAATLRHGFVHIASTGAFSKVGGAPGAWALATHRLGDLLAMGSQEGATVVDGHGRARALGALPDPRVHLFVQCGRTLLVGTESGLGLYDVTDPS